MSHFISCAKTDDAVHGNCMTAWITENDLLESFLADTMGKTSDEIIIFNHLSSSNGWPNRGGKLSFKNLKMWEECLPHIEDWVWVHMRKERFPARRRSKLSPRGDGNFQVIERINENSYKLDLPGEYNVSASFNVPDLLLLM
ncbi:succinate dehydrogenase [ubiquinone] flavoprotein subunit, mitochondrial-like [Gossypium australe]|uniref:Succinate dehydrogenase [ubiquinone] flavoprotein subunit, mitochondrial-like n=1 Tax=Gossypium australe TaxID=47621 RepID=A0A5B6VVZ7_9ROSI|nr:succinate dehydrogenase [ubiquinone] flavoprotein subunit, mitochondrial-like [Gossypium australe]